MDSNSRNSAIAAACIMLGFGTTAYFMPTIMRAVGNYSTIAACLIAIAFVGAFFFSFLAARARQGRLTCVF